MRVIAGQYKGRVLRTVRDLSVRPATDRVKQTMFDILVNRMEFDGARVLDLFAGSGSLGIEALSRGASHVVFVEQNDRAASFIEQNLTLLGCISRAEIHSVDATTFRAHTDAPFDLIFADPPYAFASTREIPATIASEGLLRRDGYLVIEHSADTEFPANDAFVVGPVKRFGRTVVTFFRSTSS
jgi:16S rRNA (guanine966-N2)-methyltransferase